MELPTRTLPHNYIAIIKIFCHVFMYSLLHCLSLIMFLRQASNAHVTPEETLQRHCE